MQKLANRLNSSRSFGHLLSFFSTRLAHYRGVPILIGVILTVISLFVHIIAAATGDPGWQFAASLVLHAALLFGLAGILLAEPLGRG